MRLQIQADGAYLDDRGNLTPISVGAVMVNDDGSVTITVPASRVDVVEPIDPFRHLDMSDKDLCAVAVDMGIVTIDQVAEVRPQVAKDIQADIIAAQLADASALAEPADPKVPSKP